MTTTETLIHTSMDPNYCFSSIVGKIKAEAKQRQLPITAGA
jgi:hypothetical protein